MKIIVIIFIVLISLGSGQLIANWSAASCPSGATVSKSVTFQNKTCHSSSGSSCSLISIQAKYDGNWELVKNSMGDDSSVTVDVQCSDSTNLVDKIKLRIPGNMGTTDKNIIEQHDLINKAGKTCSIKTKTAADGHYKPYCKW